MSFLTGIAKLQKNAWLTTKLATELATSRRLYTQLVAVVVIFSGTMRYTTALSLTLVTALTTLAVTTVILANQPPLL